MALGAATTVGGCNRWLFRQQVGTSSADPVVRNFYAQRNWRAAWSGSAARALADIIGAAAAHGLDPKAFPINDRNGTSRDEALSLAALGYARALAAGYVEPKSIEPVFTLKRNKVDLASGLAHAFDTGDLKGWFSSLAPQDGEYRALSGAYLAARRKANLAAPPATGAPVGQSMAPSDQMRQLAANLERRRWLNRTPPGHRIDVNTAGAFLGYFVEGQQVHSARTVVGREANPTPSIEAAFHRLIANPAWRVPTGIAQKELLPKGDAYLASQNMRVENGRVVQAPGPDNALGQVKFDVEDPYDIYLHDTPAKALFAQDERHRSHGCVRVQGAVDFARRLASETGKTDGFDQALASTETTAIDLGETIGVRLLYHTAYLDPSGQVLLDKDVYGTDDKLATALGLRAVAERRRAAASDDDVGP